MAPIWFCYFVFRCTDGQDRNRFQQEKNIIVNFFKLFPGVLEKIISKLSTICFLFEESLDVHVFLAVL